MPSPFAFRLFIVLSIGFGLASVLVSVLFPELVPFELSEAMEKLPMPDLIDSHPLLTMAILLPWIVAALAGVVGIFLFKRWGRALSLYSTALGFLLVPFIGPGVYSGLTSALDEVSFTLWGPVLAMAYFSPLAERFRSDAA